MRNPYVFIAIVLAVIGGVLWYVSAQRSPVDIENVDVVNLVEDEADSDGDQREERVWEPVEIIATNVDIPWDIAFLPDGRMLVTERPGRLLLMELDGSYQELLSSVGTHRGEGGLLGVAVHPDFDERGWIYLYISEAENGQILNRVEQYWFSDDALQTPSPVIADIPGAQNHDGGRIAFGPDGYLYITTGDAGVPRLAQDTDSLAGKILRIDARGEIPSDNPFGNAVYSYGHRNPQGLAWDAGGQLWSTEHGPSGEQGLCCRDEINRIEAGGNYGWPDSVGDAVEPGTAAPIFHSGTGSTWAPASAATLGNSLFFGGLRGSALYEATILNNQVAEFREHLKGSFGRIRTVHVGPDGALYLTTSNRDGRGSPRSDDDRIIRIDPAVL